MQRIAAPFPVNTDGIHDAVVGICASQMMILRKGRRLSSRFHVDEMKARPWIRIINIPALQMVGACRTAILKAV